jgi:hypothetical protein
MAKMLGVWSITLISLGGSVAIASPNMVALSLPAIAQFPTLETSAPNQVDAAFPESIGSAVLQATSAQSGLPLERLRLSQAKPKTWSDGCLGLAPPDQLCTAVLVRGWEVLVTHQRQEWVYRTSATGEKIILDPAGSHLSRLMVPPAEQIPTNQLPSKVDRSVVFREIKTGGLAGVTQEIRLYKDGRLVKQPRSTISKPSEGELIRTLPKVEVKAFQKWLEIHRFGQFGGLRYPAPNESADYFTITLGNWQTTVQYTDTGRKQLPFDLERVQMMWQGLVSRSQPERMDGRP